LDHSHAACARFPRRQCDNPAAHRRSDKQAGNRGGMTRSETARVDKASVPMNGHGSSIMIP
jgi:hypothetical protein